MNKPNIEIVRDSNVGVYMWKLPNGNYLADEYRRPLNVGPAVEHDLIAIAELARAARHFGYPEGTAEFVETHRCTEEEYLEQLEDLKNGQLPIARVRR